MEALKENFQDIQIGSSVESLQKLLESQRELFHSQIDKLQNVVVTQCKLTGVNPLAQEMAAGALSVKIGKRPRDLLNPKAVKYMQAVFSIKDAICKKESREISALFSVTVTQVRDFFTSQRSRVRKQVRLSKEKSIRSNAQKEQHDGALTSYDPNIPIEPVPLNSASISDSIRPIEPVPLNSIGPPSADEVASCSTQDSISSALDELEKHFVENISSMMCEEETFSGQVKLMEWILQMQNSEVLNWFLAKGSVMILATWLSQAAIEEQTSVLLVILKVLCHLPLHKALPEHMSAILQSVNRLRFYRTSDISNRARVLLSRWSKLFARSQAIKKTNGFKSTNDVHSQMLLKQSIVEIMGNESWNSSIGISEEIIGPNYESSENLRKLESSQAPKLLLASSDDSARKHILGASSSYTRERRKVQLVEQPGQKTAGRITQSGRAVSLNQGRPMSADDIQKAKMRAQYMQSKYGKTGSSSSWSGEAKTEGMKKPSAIQSSDLSPVSKFHVRPQTDEHKKSVTLAAKVSNKLEVPLDSKHKINPQKPLQEDCKSVPIQWQVPPEINLMDVWRVGAGESSKEIDVQRNRNRREKETVYPAIQNIPPNPKEPWDLEMDYDDSLTPEIPTEQPPDTDSSEAHVTGPHFSDSQHANVAVTLGPASSLNIGGGNAPEPDLELLAVLLKNPELVVALTSGQAGNLSSQETVKLLDMIKAGGSGLASNLNGFSKQVEERIEVSLPSPTPSSNPGMSGWRPEAVRNPFSHHSLMGSRDASMDKLPTGSLAQPHIPASIITIPQQQSSSVRSLSQHVPATMPPFSLPHTNGIIPEKHQTAIVHSLHQSLHSNFPTSPVMSAQSADKALAPKNNLLRAAGPSMRMETIINNAQPSNVLMTPERQTLSHQYPSSTLRQAPLQPDSPVHAQSYSSRQTIGNVGAVPDSWRGRLGLGSSPFSQANQNGYVTSSHGQPPSAPTWEGNEQVGSEGFESWSPESRPRSRSPEYMPGRNSAEPSMNTGWDYRSDRSRQRNSPVNWDHNRLGNRSWRDRRR